MIVKRHALTTVALSSVCGLMLGLAGCTRSTAVSETRTLDAAQQRAMDAARQQMELIPPPSKTRYMAVRSLSLWENPYVTVQGGMVTLHVVTADENKSDLGVGGMLRPLGARRQDLNVRVGELTAALNAIPEGSWPYGRVVAVEEAHEIPGERTTGGPAKYGDGDEDPDRPWSRGLRVERGKQRSNVSGSCESYVAAYRILRNRRGTHLHTAALYLATLHTTALVVFCFFFALVTVAGFWAARWRRPKAGMASLEEWGLAGRSFGTWITWFLIGGDLYTAYTVIAVPAALYGAGANGFFAVPYAIIAYPYMMVVLPRLWQVCHRHGYITFADFVGGRYGNRWLTVAIALTGILALMPYIALQLVGMKVVIGALGVTGRVASGSRLRDPGRIYLLQRPESPGGPSPSSRTSCSTPWCWRRWSFCPTSWAATHGSSNWRIRRSWRTNRPSICSRGSSSATPRWRLAARSL